MEFTELTKATITIGQLVSKDYRNAEVFRNYGIDFCCRGKRTLKDVCLELNIEQNELMKELTQITKNNKQPDQNYDNWKLDFLVDYILNTHHKYVIETIPIILEYSSKVASIHGEDHPEIILINKIIQSECPDLLNHMFKEENILFPYIRELAIAKETETKLNTNSCFGTIRNPINMMETEHISSGDNFSKIYELSNGYTPPKGACTTFKVLYAKLNEFEQDLHKHIHLENNILYKNAILLEEELLQ